MSMTKNLLDEASDAEAIYREMDSYYDECEREWATQTARDIGEALAETGRLAPDVRPEGLAGFTHWSACVETLGYREALACAREGYRDYEPDEDDD